MYSPLLKGSLNRFKLEFIQSAEEKFFYTSKIFRFHIDILNPPKSLPLIKIPLPFFKGETYIKSCPHEHEKIRLIPVTLLQPVWRKIPNHNSSRKIIISGCHSVWMPSVTYAIGFESGNHFHRMNE